MSQLKKKKERFDLNWKVSPEQSFATIAVSITGTLVNCRDRPRSTEQTWRAGGNPLSFQLENTREASIISPRLDFCPSLVTWRCTVQVTWQHALSFLLRLPWRRRTVPTDRWTGPNYPRMDRENCVPSKSQLCSVMIKLAMSQADSFRWGSSFQGKLTANFQYFQKSLQLDFLNRYRKKVSSIFSNFGTWNWMVMIVFPYQRDYFLSISSIMTFLIIFI